MHRWYQRRLWVYVGLALVLGLDAALYVGWVRGSAERSATVSAPLAQLEQEVAARAAEVARLERVHQQAPDLRPVLEKFAAERILPERTGFSGVAAELEDAASAVGVTLGTVKYETQADKQQPDLARIEIATSVEGSYPTLLRLLEALERSPHFYLINQLAVGATRGGEIRLEMKLVTYFRRSRA